jgi:serine/threonine-protein kinase
MGVVYKAEDPVLNRTVAVKTIHMPADTEARQEYEARFFQEAKAAAALNHPNIVTVHDAGRESEFVYMTMELLDGIDLRELLKRGPLKTDLALELAAQIADALGFAHGHGVVHRDIKPANIMIVRERDAKIMDFGIARVRLSDIKTQTGALLGSPKYMSPEQVSGERADHRSDVFSLGVTAYEMLAGKPPFHAEEIGQLMYQVSMTPAAPPSSANPRLPAMVDLVLARALQKAPAARYQDARELAADLRACREELTQQEPALAATVVSMPGSAAQTVSSTLMPPGGTLAVARRFDSSAAYARFETASTRSLGGTARPLTAFRRLSRDPYRCGALMSVAGATIVALIIALL